MIAASATAEDATGSRAAAKEPTPEPAKERAQIVWKGKAKDDAAPSKASEAAKPAESKPLPEPKPLQRMKPNAAFLLNVVADAQRGNERLCADEATNASLTVLGQAVSAGVRPQLDRTQEAGAPAMRAAVLSVAQQQKLATCTALLREVASVYGFALHLNPEVGEATPEPEPGSSAQLEAREGYVPMQPLHVRLNLAALSEGQRPSTAPVMHEPEPRSAPRAPAINVHANRLAGTALNALGLPGGSQPPPLAVRKLQRARATQKDRSGVFAVGDATPAESSQGGAEGAEDVLDVDADGDTDASGMQHEGALEAAALLNALEQERRPKRQRPLPVCLGNGHDTTHSSDRSEASSEADAPDEAAETLPKAWADAAQRLPNGRPSRMHMDRSSEQEGSDHQQSSEAAARKRPRTPVPLYASLPRAVAPSRIAQRSNGSGIRSSAEASSGEDPGRMEEQADQRVAPERWQQARQPQSRRVTGSSNAAEGQAADLRSRLSNVIGMRGMAADTEETAPKPGRRIAQLVAKKGTQSGRGLFGAALTGLQR